MASTVVKIKDWDYMESEFGLDINGSILCSGMSFTPEMEKLLPKNRVITVIDGNWKDYCITEYMVDTLVKYTTIKI